nr:ribonucleotide reductase N-terminal alpha domain-containing protein [Candidatus Similichlamydia epinepheli]
MTNTDVFSKVEASSLTPQGGLWEHLSSKLLVPVELPLVQSGRDILAFDLVRFVKTVACALFQDKDASFFSGVDSYRVHFLIVNVSNRILSDVRELGRTCLEAGHLENMIGSAALSVKGECLDFSRTGEENSLSSVSTERLSVILRDGRIVAWNSDKVFRAVLKAMLAQNMHGTDGRELTSDILERIEKQALSVAERVTSHIVSQVRSQIYLEEIQDCVEFTLDSMGLTSLRKLYADYRRERFILRKSESLESAGDFLSELVTPDLLTRIEMASVGLSLPHSRDELSHHIVRTMNVAMNRRERAQTVLLNARTLIEHDESYRFFAARILLTFIYEEVLDWSVQDGMAALKVAHVNGFHKFLQRGVEIGLLDPKCLTLNIPYLASFLNPLGDFQFDFLGIYTLYDRYMLHERNVDDSSSGSPILNHSRKRRIEVPQYMWMRVAIGLSFQEKKPEDAAISFYSLYNSKRFCSSTPTLFNSGTSHPQLSSFKRFTI